MSSVILLAFRDEPRGEIDQCWLVSGAEVFGNIGVTDGGKWESLITSNIF